MIQHKSKFKHYIYDLSLRNVIAVTIFTFGICFSIIVPIMIPFVAILAWICYYFEKYNIFFVYPLDFESEEMNRKTLVLGTFWAIILFQVFMIIIVSSVLTIS